MGRSPCCDKEAGLNKGPWTPEEDQKLRAHIDQHGHGRWRSLPAMAGLRRSGKSCRIRWTNYLRPDIKQGKFMQEAGLKKGPWTPEEDQKLLALIDQHGHGCWSSLPAKAGLRRDGKSCRIRWSNYLRPDIKMGKFTLQEERLKTGPWTPEEDQKLLSHIEQHGHDCWRSLPAMAGLRRCGKSCRLRWTNYLRPGLKRGKFTLQEEQSIIQLHALLGNRWSAIAKHLPKRTDNEIKNYWNTHLRKRLAQMGIDPVTHGPRADGDDAAASSGTRSGVAAQLGHATQWESAPLETELRDLASSPPASSVLDSPTSTLCFSESALFAGAAANDMHGAALHSYGEPCEEYHFGGGAEPGSVGAATFASVLLDCSVAAMLDAAAGGDQNKGEEDKGYWSSILNMVNSSMSSSFTSDQVVQDPVMYLPPATAGRVLNVEGAITS